MYLNMNVLAKSYQWYSACSDLCLRSACRPTAKQSSASEAVFCSQNAGDADQGG